MRLVVGVAAAALSAGCQCSNANSGNDDARADGSTDARLDSFIDTSAAPAEPVRVVITADNSYAFGWGDVARVNTLRGRPMYNLCSGYICPADLFDCPIGSGAAGAGPEEYTVPGAEAPESGFLYIVAWEDGVGTQGVLGQFERAGVILGTGTAAWQVCATGRRFRSNATDATEVNGPTQAAVNEEIARCTAGTGDPTTSSKGWVGTTGAVTAGAIGRLRIGEDNNSAHVVGSPIVGDNAFPIVCQRETGDAGSGRRGIDATTRWMWYAVQDSDNPFVQPDPAPNNYSRQFLIFRLPIDAIIP